jgi:hypothetical protein
MLGSPIKDDASRHCTSAHAWPNDFVFAVGQNKIDFCACVFSSLRRKQSISKTTWQSGFLHVVRCPALWAMSQLMAHSVALVALGRLYLGYNGIAVRQAHAFVSHEGNSAARLADQQSSAEQVHGIDPV